jgi:hypothetical protein
MVAHVATKEQFLVSELTAKQQEIMLTARSIQQAGGAITAKSLAKKIEGNTESPAVTKMTLAISGLTKKGCWVWDANGKMLPASDIPVILVWPDGTALAPGTGTTGRRQSIGGEAAAQAVRECVHMIQSAYKELPFDTQTHTKEFFRALEDALMEQQ